RSAVDHVNTRGFRLVFPPGGHDLVDFRDLHDSGLPPPLRVVHYGELLPGLVPHRLVAGLGRSTACSFLPLPFSDLTDLPDDTGPLASELFRYVERFAQVLIERFLNAVRLVHLASRAAPLADVREQSRRG